MLMPSIFRDDLWNNMFDFNFPDVEKTLYGKHVNQLMKTDIKEKDDNYELAVDLPGFDKEDVKAQLKNGYLIVSASKGLEKDEKNEDGKYIRQERYSGSVSRSFYVGDHITQEDIHAKYENGVLILDVPKEAPKKIEEEPSFIAIEG